MADLQAFEEVAMVASAQFGDGGGCSIRSGRENSTNSSQMLFGNDFHNRNITPSEALSSYFSTYYGNKLPSSIFIILYLVSVSFNLFPPAEI